MPIGDTIVAVATPPGRSALGIVRLSGRAARQTAAKFLSEVTWTPGKAQLAHVRDAEARVVDQVIVTFFERPRSFTAEDTVEISCHGSPVVLRHVVDSAVAAGARLAEPGEFTMRAFLNGRIDLPQAEAVRDLIEATTLYQARVAVQQTSGSVSRRIAPIKEQLLELILVLEAGIDFAEDDVAVAASVEILRRLEPVETAINRLIDSFRYGSLVHQGIGLAIVGRPNVGKSSLFNALLEQDRAIVTEIPGTTRDVVSEIAAIGGIPVKLYDTAGIRNTNERIESLGIERSYQAMADADVTLIVEDLSAPDAAALQEMASRAGGRTVLVGNKSDLPHTTPPPEMLAVSARTSRGIPMLRDAILRLIAPEGVEHESGFITSLRHEQLLRESASFLAKTREAVAADMPHEMLLVDLYAALRPIDAITGATTADDILNGIFSRFCIGK